MRPAVAAMDLDWDDSLFFVLICVGGGFTAADEDGCEVEDEVCGDDGGNVVVEDDDEDGGGENDDDDDECEDDDDDECEDEDEAGEAVTAADALRTASRAALLASCCGEMLLLLPLLLLPLISISREAAASLRLSSFLIGTVGVASAPPVISSPLSLVTATLAVTAAALARALLFGFVIVCD